MFDGLNHCKVSYFSKKYQLSPLGKKIEELGQIAVEDAIAHHKSSGNSIYYKENGRLIKESVDGTRYLVRASKSGIETIRWI